MKKNGGMAKNSFNSCHKNAIKLNKNHTDYLLFGIFYIFDSINLFLMRKVWRISYLITIFVLTEKADIKIYKIYSVS